jgi:hypothetical protein
MSDCALKKKEYLFPQGFIDTILLTGRNTRRVLPRFLYFGSGCAKRFTRQAELISEEEISVICFKCLFLFVPHSSGKQIAFSSTPHYFVFCGLLRCTIIFPHRLINVTIFRKKNIAEMEKCLDFL